MSDRIKLAEAMGWRSGRILALAGDEWFSPTGRRLLLPDPFTDANDCDLLKQWLRDRGWNIEIKWQAHTNLCPAPAVYVEIWHEASEIHHRLDSDSGESYTVARAALKVIDE